MSNIDRIIEGLQILRKYSIDLAAEHDKIYAGPDVDRVDNEDQVKLCELLWGYDDEFRCFYFYV